MVPVDGSAPATVYPQRRATPANDPRLTSPRLTRPKSFDPLKCRALFRPKPPRTWRRADYHRTRTGLRSNGPSTSSRRRAIRSEVVLGDGVQSREDVPGHRLAFECGDGLLNALLADGGVLGDQAWYSPFFRPSTSFGLASTPTRSTCDLAGVAPGRPACRACPRIPVRCGSRPRNRVRGWIEFRGDHEILVHNFDAEVPGRGPVSPGWPWRPPAGWSRGGCSAPDGHLTTVDVPAPLSPINAVTSPART
jgi:hypothetical protein